MRVYMLYYREAPIPPPLLSSCQNTNRQMYIALFLPRREVWGFISITEQPAVPAIWGVSTMGRPVSHRLSEALLLLLSRFSRVRLCTTPQTAVPRPWDSPGKNTGVGCHFRLHCMKVNCESEVAQLCPTLSDPVDCNLPGSSIHGIFQARVLEWGAIAFSSVKPNQEQTLPCALRHVISC